MPQKKQPSFLEPLRKGDEIAFCQAYHYYRPAFLRWAKSANTVESIDLLELYQDAMIILYQSLQQGKINNYDNGLLPYLFGITKNLIRTRKLKNWRVFSLDPDDEVLLQHLHFQSDFEEVHNDQWKDIFNRALAEMSENCLKIINWFYYYDYSIEVISERLGYASEEVTRVTKMRCLKQLKTIVEAKISTTKQ
jgi:RNA polymerase sigma factor (sigma-70 family)